MTGLLTASKNLEVGLRFFIASVLLLTGIGKLLDVPGFIKVIDTYKIIPAFLQPVVAISMVLVELKISENLFRNINIKITALVVTALHICFTLLASLTILRGIEVQNYGCFGIFEARPFTFFLLWPKIFLWWDFVFSFQGFTKK